MVGGGGGVRTRARVCVCGDYSWGEDIKAYTAAVLDPPATRHLHHARAKTTLSYGFARIQPAWPTE